MSSVQGLLHGGELVLVFAVSLSCAATPTILLHDSISSTVLLVGLDSAAWLSSVRTVRCKMVLCARSTLSEVVADATADAAEVICAVAWSYRGHTDELCDAIVQIDFLAWFLL